MKIIYLDSTKPDLAWFRLYYRSIFPAGAERASAQYMRAIATLEGNPFIGRATSEPGTRRLLITRTPFAIFYTVTDDAIEIVRIGDLRADPEKLGFQEEAAEFA